MRMLPRRTVFPRKKTKNRFYTHDRRIYFLLTHGMTSGGERLRFGSTRCLHKILARLRFPCRREKMLPSEIIFPCLGALRLPSTPDRRTDNAPTRQRKQQNTDTAVFLSSRQCYLELVALFAAQDFRLPLPRGGRRHARPSPLVSCFMLFSSVSLFVARAAQCLGELDSFPSPPLSLC